MEISSTQTGKPAGEMVLSAVDSIVLERRERENAQSLYDANFFARNLPMLKCRVLQCVYSTPLKREAGFVWESVNMASVMKNNSDINHAS